MDLMSPPLVGRSHELALIEGAVARLADGPVFVELVGEPGIGKTTMLRSLGEVAVAAGALVLGGRGAEFEHDRPFGILVDALDVHLEADARSWRSLDADVAAELGEIFPAMSTDAMPGRAGSSSERFRAHRAVTVLLERLAATRALVLILDDVHWADSSSVELLGALLRRPPAARVLIACACRPPQASARLLREFASAAQQGLLERIELGPLSLAEADALLTDATSHHDRMRLITESGGNPFYLHQLVRAAGRTHAVGDLGAGVPPAVVDSLLAELEGVSGSARQFARAAAVAGDPFDLDLAAQVCDLDRDTALSCIDELVGADLVRAGSDPLAFSFRHPLVRRAMYESAQPGWRVRAHTRADEAMARRGDSATERAHHVERSARVGDELAITVLVAAAAEAIVPAAAAHWLNAALRLTRADDERRLGLLCRLGEALAAAGLLEESHTALLEALACWPADGDRDSKVRLMVLCAVVDRLIGRHDRARAQLAIAVEGLDDPESAVGVEVEMELATESSFAADWATMRKHAMAAVRGATALGDQLLKATSLAIMSAAESWAMDLQAAGARLDEALALLRMLGDDDKAVRGEAFFWVGWAASFLDRDEEALESFDRGLALARRTGHSQLYVELTAGRSSALRHLGRLAEAVTSAEDAVEAARLSENPQPLAWALLMRSNAHVDAGNLTAAVRDGREGVALAVDGSVIATHCAATLGIALVEAGEFKEAFELMHEAAGGQEMQRPMSVYRPRIFEAMTRADIALGNIDRAAVWARRARSLVQGTGARLPQAQADRATAWCGWLTASRQRPLSSRSRPRRLLKQSARASRLAARGCWRAVPSPRPGSASWPASSFARRSCSSRLAAPCACVRSVSASCAVSGGGSRAQAGAETGRVPDRRH